MSLGPLLTDVVVTFCLAAGLLYHYGNCMRHHIVVTVAVLIDHLQKTAKGTKGGFLLKETVTTLIICHVFLLKVN